jgi:hypothetical protein
MVLPVMVIDWLAEERKQRPARLARVAEIRRRRGAKQYRPYSLAELLPWNYSREKARSGHREE